MGLIGEAFASGVEQAAGGLSDVMTKQIESRIVEDRAKALASFNEDLRQQGKAADFKFDTDPNNVQAKANAESTIAGAREKATSQARVDVENDPTNVAGSASRTKAINSAAQDAITEADTKRGNDPSYLKAKRNEALAVHIVDPQVQLTTIGDGRILRVDAHSGKQLGYLQDPETGKDLVGAKNIDTATMETAKSFFGEGKALEATDPAGAQRMYQLGREVLTTGKPPQTDDIRYDANGNAYRKGPYGKPVLIGSSNVQPSAAPKSEDKPAGLINSSASPQFNEAGYSTIDGTIDGAAQGNKRAQAYVRQLLEEGGLTAQQKVKALKALGS